jgi:hypothetical protein
MRIDKAKAEICINYFQKDFLSVPSEDRDLAGSSPQALREISLLPELYKPQGNIDSEAYIVNFSYRNVQVFDEIQPVLQGVFEEDACQGSEMRHHFSSWEKTVSTVLGREVKKGIYVNKVV